MLKLLNVTSRMEAFGVFLTFWRRALIGFFIIIVIAGIGNSFFPVVVGTVLDTVLVLGLVVWVVGGIGGMALGAFLCRDEEKRVCNAVDYLTDRLAPLADRHAQELDAAIAEEDAQFAGLTEHQKGVVINRVFRRIGDGN